MRLASVVLASLLAATVLGAGCSSGTAAPAEDGGAAPAEAGRDAYVGVDAGDPDPVPPDGLPEGWELERTYKKSCEIYVPKTAAYLPAPIRWEACPGTVTPVGASCQLMAIDWTPSESAYPGGAESGSRRSDGKVTLSIYRNLKPSWTYVAAAEADGPIRAAALVTHGAACSMTGVVDGDRFAWQIIDGLNTKGGAVLAGDFDSFRAAVTIPLEDSFVHTVWPSPKTLVDLRGGAFERFSWTNGESLGVLWSPSEDNGLQQGKPVFTGDAMFWPASTLLYHKVHVYTPADGVRDLLSAGLVTDRGYGDVGTDGKDLVWIEASGRTNPTGPFPTLTIMTAPYTTEPSALVPRRLRTEEGPAFGVDEFMVGCGYAARTNGVHIRVVRLSDGQSWTLGTTLNPTVAWSQPYAITCDELFARLNVDGAFRLARVRLDSLGPGLPPD